MKVAEDHSGHELFSSVSSATEISFPLFTIEMRCSSGLTAILMVSISGSRCLLSNKERKDGDGGTDSPDQFDLQRCLQVIFLLFRICLKIIKTSNTD